MPTVADLFKAAEQAKREADASRLPEGYESAIKKYQELLAADDKHVIGHMTLAVLYGKVGNHREAIEHSERACQLEPDEVFNYSALSTTYQRAFEATQDRQYIFKAEEAKMKGQELQWKQSQGGK
jgi:tetratricopeptide (TPR) repeat protein